MFTKNDRPKLLGLNDEKRHEYIEAWWAIKPADRLKLVTNELKNASIKHKPITDLSDRKQTSPYIIAAYNLEKDIEDGYTDDLEMYAESFEEPNVGMLLEILIPEKRVVIGDSPFSATSDLSEVSSVYPSIWKNMVSLFGVTLNLADFEVKIDGKKPDNDAEPNFKKIEIKFDYEGKMYKYKYKKHWVYEDALDFDIIDDVEKFGKKHGVQDFFLKIEGNFGDCYFLLPKSVIESLDKYVDHAG